MLASEAFRAFRDQHHMRALFEHRARGADGILNAPQAGNRAGAESGRFHDDGVALDMPVEREVRAVAGVENRIVFENHDGGLDRVKRVPAVFEDAPAGIKGPQATCVTCINSFVGNIPGSAVDDERGSHGYRA